MTDGSLGHPKGRRREVVGGQAVTEMYHEWHAGGPGGQAPVQGRLERVGVDKIGPQPPQPSGQGGHIACRGQSRLGSRAHLVPPEITGDRWEGKHLHLCSSLLKPFREWAILPQDHVGVDVQVFHEPGQGQLTAREAAHMIEEHDPWARVQSPVVDRLVGPSAG